MQGSAPACNRVPDTALPQFEEVQQPSLQGYARLAQQSQAPSPTPLRGPGERAPHGPRAAARPRSAAPERGGERRTAPPGAVRKASGVHRLSRLDLNGRRSGLLTWLAGARRRTEAALTGRGPGPRLVDRPPPAPPYCLQARAAVWAGAGHKSPGARPKPSKRRS